MQELDIVKTYNDLMGEAKSLGLEVQEHTLDSLKIMNQSTGRDIYAHSLTELSCLLRGYKFCKNSK